MAMSEACDKNITIEFIMLASLYVVEKPIYSENAIVYQF
jgi:hypothetical protein